ncbi:hypothetical protein OIU91_06330 [Streptomyces sp. NBC_01456]|uniref:hypothetical protein n=1 Tax=Streptomyces sp. NBC_01456 TaxID=2975868 RepID=UPI002E35426F|nr:hypothetical protein [Streptomyces sp. NBC_01456]
MPQSRIRLFGPDRQMVGIPEIEWSVWILGMDDIHEQESLAHALQFAAEHNAMFADNRLHYDTRHTLHAVVLHHGFAWTQATEHALGVDCGHSDCGACGFGRSTSKAAS